VGEARRGCDPVYVEFGFAGFSGNRAGEGMSMEFTDAPLEPFGEKILDMSIPTQLSLKTPVVFRMVKELKARACLPWTGAARAELAFDEAITNAMVHGNRLDPSKKVHVTAFADEQCWGAIVEDEGEGFKPEDIPDPNDTSFRFRDAGRGILLINGYVDELKYNRKGNRLLMARHRQVEPEKAEAQAALAPEEAPPPAEAPVSRSLEDGIEVVQVLSERVNDENVSVIREAVMGAAQEGARVVIDLGQVSYISSAGLGMLVMLSKNASPRKVEVVLAAVQPGVKDILDSAHLGQLFRQAPDRAAAKAKLKERG
jgi:serine/threonine-protein kinase RsbW